MPGHEFAAGRSRGSPGLYRSYTVKNGFEDKVALDVRPFQSFAAAGWAMRLT
jgi:hypothetical protein